jgi:hypothetical protein
MIALTPEELAVVNGSSAKDLSASLRRRCRLNSSDWPTSVLEG